MNSLISTNKQRLSKSKIAIKVKASTDSILCERTKIIEVDNGATEEEI